MEHSDAGPVCALRPGAPLTALAEVQRVAGPVRFDFVSSEQFETRLALAYRDNASEASDAAGEHGDLASLADSAAVVDDLLDNPTTRRSSA